MSFTRRVCFFLLHLVLTVRTTGNQPKIVGGTQTSISQLPFLINIRENGQFICGGSLVSTNCVLTAAHCAYGTSPTALTAHAGTSRLSETGVERPVAAIFLSPNYSPSTLDSDLAILQLSSALTGGNVGQVPLCTRHPAVNEPVTIAGWGLTKEYRRAPSDRLRSTSVRVVDQGECATAYAHEVRVTDAMFCATVPGRRDSCSGDSGGPVVYDGRVCGIVSWGVGCARRRYPGVYTNVSNERVMSFIRQVMGQHC